VDWCDELSAIARQKGLITEIGDNEGFHVSYPVYSVTFTPITRKEDKPFLCPECGRFLIVGPERKRYETLSEHVSSPNDEPPSRITFICGDANCPTRKMSLYWGYDGSLFFSISDNVAYKWFRDNEINPRDRSTHHRKGTAAVHSFDYFYNHEKCFQNKTNAHRFWFETIVPKWIHIKYKVMVKLGLRKKAFWDK
jgi:hypothetical protein